MQLREGVARAPPCGTVAKGPSVEDGWIWLSWQLAADRAVLHWLLMCPEGGCEACAKGEKSSMTPRKRGKTQLVVVGVKERSKNLLLVGKINCRTTMEHY